jgi:hypothetical protein
MPITEVTSRHTILRFCKKRSILTHNAVHWVPYPGKACCKLRHCIIVRHADLLHFIMRSGRETELVKCQLCVAP